MRILGYLEGKKARKKALIFYFLLPVLDLGNGMIAGPSQSLTILTQEKINVDLCLPCLCYPYAVLRIVAAVVVVSHS